MRIALVALVSFAACKSGGEQTTTTKTSCLVRATNSCQDYESRSKTFTTGRENDCKAAQGIWAATPCPTEGLLGTCREETKNWSRSHRYYFGESKPLANLEVECKAYGAWIAAVPAVPAAP